MTEMLCFPGERCVECWPLVALRGGMEGICPERAKDAAEEDTRLTWKGRERGTEEEWERGDKRNKSPGRK